MYIFNSGIMGIQINILASKTVCVVQKQVS